MSSIVLELQASALDYGTPVAHLLSKARVIAAKLNLSETEHWIALESDGYHSGDQLPDYRYVTGELKYANPYRGWQPIVFGDDHMAEIFAKRGVFEPIAELEDLLSGGNGHALTMTISSSIKNEIYSGLNLPPHDVKYHVSRAQFVGIVSAVRQRILDWTLTLEKNNILGEGMTFTPQEKQRVSESKTIFNVHIGGNMAGSIGAVSDHATVNVTQTIQGVDPAVLQTLLDNLQAILKDEQFTGRDEVDHELAKLHEEAATGEPRQKTVVATLKKVLGPIGKATAFAGRVAAEHEIGSYLDALPL